MKLKKLLRREPKSPDPGQAVTNATLEEYRKKIFARGRRFVYPVYVAKHRIVFLSLFLVVVLCIVLVASSAAAIYRYRVENDLMYRVSRIIPFPAVKVDGSYGSYREYLLILRSSQAFLSQKNTDGQSAETESSQSGELRADALQELKRRVKLKAIAKEKSVSVTPEEIDDQLTVLEAASGSQGRFEDIVGEYYKLTPAELREQIRIQLLKQKVIQFLDSDSAARANQALAKLQAGADFTKVAKAYTNTEEDPLGADEKGETSIILTDEVNYPPALLEAVNNLSEGSLSGAIYSPAGIHIIRRGATKGEETALSHIFISYQDVNKLLDEHVARSASTSYLRSL
jgi:hypothetical protein